ncbi:ABC transporter permease [Hippea alviniae]|uniref:ABC transporter permease n=1 Tax=Hippea alviniae TaxID=1279027 RepID=UPI0003B4F970|nr:ABC transporter permease [Hippea alviniae]
MLTIISLTFKSAFKDRIGIVILSMVLLYIIVPVFSSFSMRQLQEVSITMSITLNSFILLLLAIFGSVATVFRDIERKFVYTLLSHPLKRSDYFIGRFIGFALAMLVVLVINFVLSVISIKICASMYKSRLPLLWSNIAIAFIFSYLQYLLLMAFGFLFASFATSFFMPFFATIATFIAGNASQGIYDYIFHSASKEYSELFKGIIKVVYYVLPNFSSFDFSAYAAYALKISSTQLINSLMYFALYFTIVISVALIVFNKRDLT